MTKQNFAKISENIIKQLLFIKSNHHEWVIKKYKKETLSVEIPIQLEKLVRLEDYLTN